MPYVQGATFTIYSHLPPQPTPRRYHECKKNDFDEQEQMTLIERSLLHPPLPGTTLDAEAVSMTIAEEIVVRSDHGAQILGAQILGVNDSLVAKIYDPLYYPILTLHNDVGADPFRCADHEYSHEAAAYAELSDELGGGIIPSYYGSYTFALPMVSPSGHTTRSVRLILIERILGTCMRDLDLTRISLPQHQRANVIAKIVDAESLLEPNGVIHGDLHPRNIILCGDDLGSASLRVVLIDFGRSVLDYELDPFSEAGLPISPLLRWDTRFGRHRDFVTFGWVDWDWQQWLEQVWTGSEAYTPITEESRKHILGWFDNRRPA